MIDLYGLIGFEGMEIINQLVRRTETLEGERYNNNDY